MAEYRRRARRRSGDVRVYVTYVPRHSGGVDPWGGEYHGVAGYYHCVVARAGRGREVWVSPPEMGWASVDSSEAFDAAARCAIEADDHDHPDDGIYESCEVAEDGLVLSRAA